MAHDEMDLEALKQDIAEKANEALGRAAEFAREKPHAAVAMAFGVGWVLGNGLPPRLLLGAARIGWKAAIGGLIASGGLASALGAADGASQREASAPAGGRASSAPSTGGRRSHAGEGTTPRSRASAAAKD